MCCWCTLVDVIVSVFVCTVARQVHVCIRNAQHIYILMYECMYAFVIVSWAAGRGVDSPWRCTWIESDNNNHFMPAVLRQQCQLPS